MLASIKFLDSRKFISLSVSMLSEKMFCDLIHSEDTFIIRNVGRWSRLENEAKGSQSLEVRLTRTGSDATADFFSLKVLND